MQCSDESWNYDPYMHGMANGMIFDVSLFDNKPPRAFIAYMKSTESLKLRRFC